MQIDYWARLRNWDQRLDPSPLSPKLRRLRFPNQIIRYSPSSLIRESRSRCSAFTRANSKGVERAAVQSNVRARLGNPNAKGSLAISESQLETFPGLSRRTTCYRILQTLMDHDWLRVNPARVFSFSSGMLPLLKPLSDYQKLFYTLAVSVSILVEKTGLTAKISVKQGDDGATVYRTESPRALFPSFKLGVTFPLA